MNESFLQNQSSKVKSKIRNNNFFKNLPDHEGRFSQIKFRMIDLTQERLRSLFHYDPLTGMFTRIKSGESPYFFYSDGFREDDEPYTITVDGRAYLSARLAWMYMEGYFPEGDVAHKDSMKRNNKWKNLKHVTRSCSLRNRKVNKNNSSGVIGVQWNEKLQKWVSNIGVNGKPEYLGSFKNLEEAAQIRWDAEVKYGYPDCQTTSTALQYLMRQI